MAIDCPELPLSVARYYNSQNRHAGPLGGQWMHSMEMELVRTNLVEHGYANAYSVMHVGGSERLWFKDNGTNSFASPFASTWTLAATTSGAYVARSPEAFLYLFDSNGVIQRVTGPASNSLTFAYSNSYPTQLLVSVTHDNQKALSFEYATNRLVWVRTDFTNLSLRYDYNAAGQLTGAVIFNGEQVTTTRYWYAATTSSWNGLTQIVNAVGHRFSYGYETNSGGPIGPRGTSMWADSNYYAHTVSYSTGQTSTATITYDRGDTNQVWSYEYSPGLQRVKSIWGPVTNEGRIFTLDGLGFKRGECLTNSVSGLYLSTLYTLDVRDNVNGMATGYGVQPTNWWGFTWDTNYTVMTSSLDPEGHRVEWEYTNGLVSIARVYPVTNQPVDIFFSYTANGLLTAITNANGNWVRYGYDGSGNPTSIVPRAGPSKSLAWDELGHLQQIDLPSGEYTTNNPPQMVPRSILYDRDALGRVLAIGWPDETTETFSYDAIGNMTNHVDAMGRTNSFTWLPTRKLAAKTRGSGSETVTNRYDYDQQLNTLAIRDEEGRAVESYLLDLKDRPVKVTNVESQEMTIAWALANMPQSMVRFDGTTNQYAYDQAGLLSGIVFPDQAISFKYYMNGLVMTASNQWGVISNAYDGANRLVSVAQPAPNGSIDYAYYPAGQISNVVSVAGINRYVLDEADRLATLIATRQGVATQAFEYAYNDINGRVSNMTYPNGVSCSYSYDVMDRVQSIVWRGASNQVLRSLQYGRNPIGMITNISRESGESSAYVYDSLDRLVEERKVQAGGVFASRFLLGYDRVGNRTNKTVYSGTSNLVAQVDYVRGLGNRLSSWSLAGTNRLGLIDVSGVSTEIIGTNDVYGQSWVSNRYVVRPAVAGSNYWVRDFAVGAGTQQVVAIIRDRAGNPGFATNTVIMALVTNGTYQYNPAGCVTNIRYAGTDATNSIDLNWDGHYQLTEVRNSTNVVERFGYDANGRMLWRWDGTETNWMVYNAFHIVAEVSDAGALRKSYIYGPGWDNILSMTTYGTSTNTYYYLKDHLGSVLAITDDSGAVIESYAYDAWGRVSVYGPTGEQIAASAIGNRYCWQGREYSWASGLYYFRARWYDPVTGRWLSNDPIGITGGQNQYVFCGNCPTMCRDPLGLCPKYRTYGANVVDLLINGDMTLTITYSGVAGKGIEGQLIPLDKPFTSSGVNVGIGPTITISSGQPIIGTTYSISVGSISVTLTQDETNGDIVSISVGYVWGFPIGLSWGDSGQFIPP